MIVEAQARPTRSAVHSVFVDLEDGLRYQYMCREEHMAPPHVTYKKSIEIGEVQELTADLSSALSRSIQLRLGEAELRHWGGKLYDRLIPPELSEAFRRDSRPSYLILYLDPAFSWIPWELLWDGDEFLCRRFRLARLLKKSVSEFKAAEARLHAERSGLGALIVFGDVTGLEANEEKAAIETKLRSIYGENVWFCSAQGAANVLEELKKDYEICHFIGHGRFCAERPETSGWTFPDGSVLSCQRIEAVSSRAEFPFLVFANSCDSARSAMPDAQAYITTLYRAFLRQGVPHYVGTIVPVPDEAAKKFAYCFYNLLADGPSVGEALCESRRAFAETRKTPIWACYVHYGDPTDLFAATPRMRSRESADEAGRCARVSFSVLGRSSSDEVRGMLEHYKTAVAKNPADGEAHYASGLCYLQLGLHELAVRNFKRTVELMPDWAAAYYYYALSLIRGRRPKLLSLGEVRLVEQYLETALQLDGRPATYYYLLAILKFDYYTANGLLCRPPSPDELLSIAQNKEHDPWELERLLKHVVVQDPGLLSRIRR